MTPLKTDRSAKKITSRRRSGIIAAILLILTVVTTAYAGITFMNVTGPVWDDPGDVYTFTVDVSAITNPTKQVCMQYDIGSGDVVVQCACNAPSCTSGTGVGTWVCSIPETANATISWRMGGWTAGGGGNCGSETDLIGSGSFSTGPTAVSLTSAAADSDGISWLALATGWLALVTLGLVLSRKRLHRH